MARVAIIENGKVSHIIEVTPPWVPPQGVHAVAAPAANIGDSFDGSTFSPPAPPTEVADLQRTADLVTTKHIRESRLFDVGGQMVLCNAQPHTRSDLRTLADWGAKNQSVQRVWIDDTGARTPLTGAQFVKLQAMVDAYLLTVYAIAAKVSDGIHATPPTITTHQQIVAAFN